MKVRWFGWFGIMIFLQCKNVFKTGVDSADMEGDEKAGGDGSGGGSGGPGGSAAAGSKGWQKLKLQSALPASATAAGGKK